MEYSFSWLASASLAIQDISCIWSNPKIHCNRQLPKRHSRMNTLQIERILTKHVKYFQGVYPVDLLPQTLTKPAIIIVNLDEHYQISDRGMAQVARGASQRWWWPAGRSRSPVKRPQSRPNESCPTVFSWALFGYPDWGFTVIFLSCKANAAV
jgi:hypothetical protein